VTGPDPSAGVFTTLLARGGTPVAAAAHVARIAASIRSLYDVEVDEAALVDLVEDAVAPLPGTTRVRVDHLPGGPTPYTVTTTALPERPREPWRLVVRRVPGGWGPHKWRDRSLLQAWTDADDAAVDPLLVDEHDVLLETGRGNVFVVRAGVVATPPLDGRILPGVTRDLVLGLLAGIGVPHQERAIDRSELSACDEVFVTNALGGVRRVATCDDLAWEAGPVARAVDAALEEQWDRDAPA
jgi:para-aminobenzoate synthetase/4-amino-4-deoxychorismate lyase